MAFSAALFGLFSSLTDRGFLKLYGLGLSFIWLPYFMWGIDAFLFVSFFMIGAFFGPIKIVIDSLLQKVIKKHHRKDLGRMMAVIGALVSASIGMGFAFSGFFASGTPAFPGAFLPLGIIFTLGGLFHYFKAPQWLEGHIKKDLFSVPGWLKGWLPWNSQTRFLPVGLKFRRLGTAMAAGFLGIQAAAPSLDANQGLAALESRIRKKDLKTIFVDYDGTLMDKSADNKAVSASESLLKLLRDLRQKTGVQIVIVTNHFFEGDDNSMSALLTDRLDPETRAGMMVVTVSGSRIHQYGPNGERPKEPIWEETRFDKAERDLITPAFEEAARQVGLEETDYKLFHEETRTLIEIHNEQDRVQALTQALADANDSEGWGYLVQAKEMPTMRGVPYVQYFKANKGTGARQAFSLLKSQGLIDSDKQVLILGDDLKEGGNDLFMAEAFPKALAISVGKAATAVQANVLQWGRSGASAAHEVLRGIVKIFEKKDG